MDLDVVAPKVEGIREVKRDHLKNFFREGNYRGKFLFPVEQLRILAT
jgi:hypothetical protein